MEEDNTTVTDEVISGDPIKFILLLITEILSYLCTLLILSFLLFNWRSLIIKGLRNHFILSLVLVTFIYLTLDLPFTIQYYELGYDMHHSILFCLWWYWLDYTLVVICIFLTAAASIQRHILIFHAHWLHQYRLRWMLHFVPILACFVYPGVFYLVVMSIHPCVYDESIYCPAPCYTENIILFNLDWILNTAFPLSTIILANITLIVRVIRSMKKTRRRPSLTWKRQRKLTLQLVALSSLFVLGWAPSTVVSIVQSFALPTLFSDIPELDYLNYLTYFVCPLQPFLCLFGLPELLKSLTTSFKLLFRRSRVNPVNTV
ncbi:unnamed protein product [Adineta ricciae]|uniref:G-protein coupled receptors family 1 profile domain-containing protein n=1 Tax=Adineta ricciae TaxID=249248 RepID=A0A814B410_ADIRI|nr:unnamed protein product [Adineta ricciae]